jgi:hypothetical protein
VLEIWGWHESCAQDLTKNPATGQLHLSEAELGPVMWPAQKIWHIHWKEYSRRSKVFASRPDAWAPGNYQSTRPESWKPILALVPSKAELCRNIKRCAGCAKAGEAERGSAALMVCVWAFNVVRLPLTWLHQWALFHCRRGGHTTS